MSTIDLIEKEMRKNISEIQALAMAVMNSPTSSDIGLKDLSAAALQQSNIVLSDQIMPKFDADLTDDVNISVAFTGEDVLTDDDAVKIVPTLDEARADQESASEREKLLLIVREAAYDLIQKEILNHSVYLTNNSDFNCKIDISVPSEHAKLLFDAAIHYYPINEKSSKSYSKSRKFEAPSIRIVCYPDWVNDEWLYWKSKANNDSEAEPPRIMMIYDVETNSAFLLGARNFSEIRKAIKILAWNTAIQDGSYLPLNAVAKTISTTKSEKKSETTFLTVSSCERARSFFGLNVHSSDFNQKIKGTSATTSGDSGLLMFTAGSGRKRALINFGRNYFGSIESALAKSPKEIKLLSAENLAVVKNGEGKKELLLNQTLSPNAMVHTLFEQEEKDLSLPEYIALIVNDELLPPATLIKDFDLIAATWFTYTTRCGDSSDLSDLCIVPGGNPNIVWDVAREITSFGKALKKAKSKLILLNCGSFFDNDNSPIEIGDELLLSVYVKIAKNEMKWKEWKIMPGHYLPDRAIFKNIQKECAKFCDPQKLCESPVYLNSLRDYIELKIEYLRAIDAPSNFFVPLYKILSRLV